MDVHDAARAEPACEYGSEIYFEAALLIALLGFVSTIALAKFLMRAR